jgi:hypothetical protein
VYPFRRHVQITKETTLAYKHVGEKANDEGKDDNKSNKTRRFLLSLTSGQFM